MSVKITITFAEMQDSLKIIVENEVKNQNS
jgi:hypothetical protein